MSKIFDSILGIFSSDLAIDLGTANTCVFVKGTEDVAKRKNYGSAIVFSFST